MIKNRYAYASFQMLFGEWSRLYGHDLVASYHQDRDALIVNDHARGLRAVASISMIDLLSLRKFHDIIEPVYWWLKLVDAFEGRRPLVWC